VNTKQTKQAQTPGDRSQQDVESEQKRIVPPITGALGTITKGYYQNLQLFSGHLLAMELQKITLISTEHIISKVLGSINLISC